MLHQRYNFYDQIVYKIHKFHIIQIKIEKKLIPLTFGIKLLWPIFENKLFEFFILNKFFFSMLTFDVYSFLTNTWIHLKVARKHEESIRKVLNLK